MGKKYGRVVYNDDTFQFTMVNHGHIRFITDREFEQMCKDADIPDGNMLTFEEVYDFTAVYPVNLVGEGDGFICFL